MICSLKHLILLVHKHLFIKISVTLPFFMSWQLQESGEKSEDEDSEFYVISDESDDEEDNRLRNECDKNMEFISTRKIP